MRKARREKQGKLVNLTWGYGVGIKDREEPLFQYPVKNKVQLTCSVVFTTLKNKSLYRVFSFSWLASIRAFTEEKSFNSNRVGLEHQYGCCDVM